MATDGEYYAMSDAQRETALLSAVNTHVYYRGHLTELYSLGFYTVLLPSVVNDAEKMLRTFAAQELYHLMSRRFDKPPVVTPLQSELAEQYDYVYPRPQQNLLGGFLPVESMDEDDARLILSQLLARADEATAPAPPTPEELAYLDNLRALSVEQVKAQLVSLANQLVYQNDLKASVFDVPYQKVSRNARELEQILRSGVVKDLYDKLVTLRTGSVSQTLLQKNLKVVYPDGPIIEWPWGNNIPPLLDDDCRTLLRALLDAGYKSNTTLSSGMPKQDTLTLADPLIAYDPGTKPKEAAPLVPTEQVPGSPRPQPLPSTNTPLVGPSNIPNLPPAAPPVDLYPLLTVLRSPATEAVWNRIIAMDSPPNGFIPEPLSDGDILNQNKSNFFGFGGAPVTMPTDAKQQEVAGALMRGVARLSQQPPPPPGPYTADQVRDAVPSASSPLYTEQSVKDAVNLSLNELGRSNPVVGRILTNAAPGVRDQIVADLAGGRIFEAGKSAVLDVLVPFAGLVLQNTSLEDVLTGNIPWAVQPIPNLAAMPRMAVDIGLPGWKEPVEPFSSRQVGQRDGNVGHRGSMLCRLGGIPFEIPPAIKSQLGLGGMSAPEVPGAQIGIPVLAKNIIGKVIIPGGFPVLQSLGVQGLELEMVGMFLGFDHKRRLDGDKTYGSQVGETQEYYNPNNPDPFYTTRDRRGGAWQVQRLFDRFRIEGTPKELEFLSGIVQIKYSVLIREFQCWYARDDRVYYAFKFEVVGSRELGFELGNMVSNLPIRRAALQARQVRIPAPAPRSATPAGGTGTSGAPAAAPVPPKPAGTNRQISQTEKQTEADYNASLNEMSSAVDQVFVTAVYTRVLQASALGGATVATVSESEYQAFLQSTNNAQRAVAKATALAEKHVTQLGLSRPAQATTFTRTIDPVNRQKARLEEAEALISKAQQTGSLKIQG